jgi:hypothetical protein
MTLTGGETFSFGPLKSTSTTTGTMKVVAGPNSVTIDIASVQQFSDATGIYYSISLPPELSNSVFPILITVAAVDPAGTGYVAVLDTKIFGGTLPVQLSAFTIKDARKNTVELDWTTIGEKNNYGFYVQKSADGKNNFATLGFVPGNGTTLSTHNYSYPDNASPFTFYRLKQVDMDGSIQYSNTISPAMTGPSAMSTPRLDQNFPNPFNPSTQIAFSITKEGPVSLRVYDILGREVATLVNENRKAGEYTERFDGSRLASGVYMYVLQSADGRLTSRMILSK